MLRPPCWSAGRGPRRTAGAARGPGDRLIVTGEHRGDPTIGHALHTCEYVPVLIHRPGARGVELLPDAHSLADIGATAALSPALDLEGLAVGPPHTGRHTA